ncbi:MAG TPA: tryptophan--tRNA ligase, partial [Pyrinomonadaceae bacterium]|nr:tryptophan--tRNA ligase [Pyrinomonadaceae bacterium]
HEYESFFCIVNLHAITLPQDPAVLRQKTLDLARIYLAAGIDPEVSTIFIQSDVPAHTELTWILSCIARMGELERMTQFKDKGKGNTERAGVGLFAYPVLMASDILLYQTDLVPVGKDQKQHLELTRDLAERFNRDFGEIFKIPEPYIPPVGANILSLQEPTRKMSKSDENAAGSIFLLDDADTVTKKVKRAVTDSGTEIKFDASRPAINNLLTIYQLFTGKTAEECEAHFAGKGYGQFKTELAEATVEFLRPFQERMKEYDDAALEKILRTGAETAAEIAGETLRSAYDKMGIAGFRQ